MMLKLYKISQDVNNDYDTYDSAVVCAESVEDAKRIDPCEYHTEPVPEHKEDVYMFSGWCSVDDVKVEELGNANENIPRGVVVASFNAG